MALWRKNNVLSQQRQKRLEEKRKNESLVRRGSFYHYWETNGTRPNEHYECAGNRRVADSYVQNF